MDWKLLAKDAACVICAPVAIPLAMLIAALYVAWLAFKDRYMEAK